MLPHFKRQLCEFVERNIPDFHCRRLESLKRLKLKDILRRKNPYLFRAKNTFTAEELVRSILDAYLSSQEETLFGAFLERVVIFILMARNQPPKALTWNLCVMMFYTSYPSCPGQIGEIAVS